MNVARLISVNSAFPASIWPVPSKNLCTTMIPFHKNGLCLRNSSSDMPGGMTTNGNKLALASLYSSSITSASAWVGQMEVRVGLETGLSCSLVTDVPGVMGAAVPWDSDGNRWQKGRVPVQFPVGLGAEVALDEFSWEASWSSLFSSSATRVVFWTFFARGGAGIWLPQDLLSR